MFRRLRAAILGPDPAPALSRLDRLDRGDVWGPEHDVPIDLVPTEFAPTTLPAGLLPQPGTTRIAYNPTTGALVRIPSHARTTDDVVVTTQED